jgi:hypothetical protein
MPLVLGRVLQDFYDRVEGVADAYTFAWDRGRHSVGQLPSPALVRL